MTKEKYIELVNHYLKWRETEDNIYEASCKTVSLWECDPLQEVMSDYLALLCKHVSDEPDGDYTMLDYFIWELDCGKEWKPGMIKDKDGNDIKLQTLEDLADYIFREK